MSYNGFRLGENTMGKRGAAPRPNHLKAIEGVHEFRINRDEPIPDDDPLAIRPPTKLDRAAQAVWDRLAPDLIAKRVLTAWDVDAFAEFCRSVVLYNRAAADAEVEPLTVEGSTGNPVVNPTLRALEMAHKMMRATGQRFGLTPGDRASLKVEHGNGSKSGAERYLS